MLSKLYLYLREYTSRSVITLTTIVKYTKAKSNSRLFGKSFPELEDC